MVKGREEKGLRKERKGGREREVEFPTYPILL